MSAPLDFDLLIRDANWNAQLNAAERRMIGFSNATVRETSRIDDSFRRLSQLTGGAFLFAGLSELPQQIVKVRSEFQQLETSFTSILKSKEKADALLGSIKEYAGVNPSSVLETAQASKQLLAYGFAAEKIIPTITKLGDISAGLGTPLGDLTYLIGTTFTQGRLYVQDFNQFVGRGIPLTKALSEVMGVAESEVRGLVEAGKIGFPEIEKAITNLTKKGSIFGGLSLEANKSFKGLTSQLGDAWEAMLNDIGQQNEGVISGVIGGAIDAVKNYKKVIDIIEVLVGTYTAYRAAVAITLIAEKQLAAARVIETASAESVAAAKAASLARVEGIRAEVSALAAKKAALVEAATAQNASVVAARAELLAAQAAATAGTTLLDAKQKAALANQVQVAQNNLIAAQETASITRKRAIAVSQEFYATRQALTTAATTAGTVAETSLTSAQSLRLAITRQVTAAQAALNGTMLANPVVLLVTAIVGLTYAYFQLREEAVEVKSAQDLIGDANKETTTSLKQQKAEVGSLIAVLKNQNVAESERLKAYTKLKDISPDIVAGLDFQKAKTADLTKSVNEYSIALEKSIRLEAGRAKIKAAIDQEFEAEENLRKKQEAFFKKQQAANETADSRNAGQGTAGGGTGGNFQKSTELANAKAELDAAAELAVKAKGVTAEVKKGFEAVLGEGTKQALEAQQAILSYNATKLDKTSKAYKLNEEKLKANQDQLEKLANKKPAESSFGERLAKAETAGALRAVKAYADTESKLDQLNKQVGSRIKDAKNGSKEKAQLEALEKDINRALGKQSAADKRAAKEAEKSGAFGSVAYYEQIAKKAADVLEKTASTNQAEIQRQTTIRDTAQDQAEAARIRLETVAGTVEYYEKLADLEEKKLNRIPDTDPIAITRQLAVVVEAQNKAEEARKSVAIRSFSDELDQKKQQYELYQRWVDTYGQESADAQFSTLKKSGASYVDFLTAEIAKLEAKRSTSTLSEKETVNLDNLTTRRNEATGVKSPIDLFTESLSRAKAEAASLTDYLTFLQAEQAKLGPGDYEKKIVVTQQTIVTRDERKGELQNFLVNATASEQQRLAIAKRYADLRAEVEQQANGQITKANQEKLRLIGQAEEDELKQVQERQLQESAEYRKLTQVILEEGQKGLKIQIANQQAVVNKAKKLYGEQSEIYRREQKILNGLNKQFSDGQLANLTRFAGLLGELGGSLAGLGGDAAEAGRFIIGLTSNIGLLTESLKKGATQEDKYASGLQGLIGLIDVLGSSAAQRRQAEEAFAQSRNSQQQQYLLLLNEEIGLRSQTNSSIFIKDFAGELKDGFAKYRDAQKNYQEAIAKLNSGQVKAGQRNAVDLGAVGKAALSGAAIGAVAGPIGAAIGGLIGGAIGLFGGKKKQDEYANLLQTYPELLRTSASGVREVNQEIAKSLLSSGQLDDSTKQLVQNTLDWAKAAEDAKKQIEGIISSLAGDLAGSLRTSLIDAFKAGENAADAMARSVSESLESVLSQLIFNQIFAAQFKQLEGELKTAFESGGDLTGVYSRFFEASKQLSDQFDSALETASKEAEKAGLSVFKKTSKDKTANGLSSSIKADLTEQTAGILAGEITAIRIVQAQGAVMMRESLLYLAGINQNTSNIDRNTANLESKLDRIVDALKSDPLRGKGL
ncbi:tape measure protein [Fibrella sp. ES10-3-2-2]|nr:hypothetical protein A6C57_00335 [Fibrella sp. ES10-3-2-2]